MFKKRRGIDLSYNEQGLIYFVCANYKTVPPKIQQKILNLCVEVAGEHYRALFAMLTDTSKNTTAISLEHHISESQLYYYRKKFYECFKLS